MLTIIADKLSAAGWSWVIAARHNNAGISCSLIAKT